MSERRELELPKPNITYLAEIGGKVQEVALIVKSNFEEDVVPGTMFAGAVFYILPIGQWEHYARFENSLKSLNKQLPKDKQLDFGSLLFICQSEAKERNRLKKWDMDLVGFAWDHLEKEIGDYQKIADSIITVGEAPMFAERQESHVVIKTFEARFEHHSGVWNYFLDPTEKGENMRQMLRECLNYMFTQVVSMDPNIENLKGENWIAKNYRDKFIQLGIYSNPNLLYGENAELLLGEVIKIVQAVLPFKLSFQTFSSSIAASAKGGFADSDRMVDSHYKE